MRINAVKVKLSWEDQIKKAKEKESFVQYELYRLIKNAISEGLEYSSGQCKFIEVLPEIPVGKGKL